MQLVVPFGRIGVQPFRAQTGGLTGWGRWIPDTYLRMGHLDAVPAGTVFVLLLELVPVSPAMKRGGS